MRDIKARCMDEEKSIFYWIRKDVMRAEHISTYLSKIINDNEQASPFRAGRRSVGKKRNA